MKNLAVYVAIGLSLSACSVGMGVGIGVNSNTGISQNEKVVTSYPVETAMLNIYTRARSETTYALVDEQSVRSDIRVTPTDTVVFDNKVVQGAEIVASTKLNGKIIDQSQSVNYFTLDPLIFKGFSDSSGEYSIATQTAVIPKLAQVGDSSTFVTENVYTDSSKLQKISNYSQSWSLNQDGLNTAWLCINSSANTLVAVDPDGTTSECYKIDAKGQILASKSVINLPTTNGIDTITFASR